MKTLRCLLGCALSVLAFATGAQAASGGSANGDFSFGVEGAAGAIQFDAREQNPGETRGQMVLLATVDVSNEDVDGTGEPTQPLSQIALGVSFDCLKIDGNRAAMSGIVTSANDESLVGRRTTLIVADNEEGETAPDLDKFTWGIYINHEWTWIPADAELESDDGASLIWTASDAEREDDPGIPASTLSTQGPPVVDCNSFSLSAYSLVDLPLGSGNIQVRQ